MKMQRRLVPVAAVVLFMAGCATPKRDGDAAQDRHSVRPVIVQPETLVLAIHAGWDNTNLTPEDWQHRAAPVMDAVERKLGRGITRLSALSPALPDAALQNTAALCRELSQRGRKGQLLAISVASSEMFGLGLSSGRVRVGLELWDISNCKRVYEDSNTQDRTMPILWVLNYHEFSGNLNAAGLQALDVATQKVLANLAPEHSSAMAAAR